MTPPLRSSYRQRGAALVEALVVTSFTILMMCCILVFYQLYAARMESVREARGAAWQASLAGCQGWASDTLVGAYLSVQDGLSTPTGEQFAGLSSDSQEPPPWLLAARETGSGSGQADYSGPRQDISRSYGESMIVACNELPHQGEDAAMAPALQAAGHVGTIFSSAQEVDNPMFVQDPTEQCSSGIPIIGGLLDWFCRNSPF